MPFRERSGLCRQDNELQWQYMRMRERKAGIADALGVWVRSVDRWAQRFEDILKCAGRTGSVHLSEYFLSSNRPDLPEEWNPLKGCMRSEIE